MLFKYKLKNFTPFLRPILDIHSFVALVLDLEILNPHFEFVFQNSDLKNKKLKKITYLIGYSNNKHFIFKQKRDE